MKLEEMELALARFDALLSFLRKQLKAGTNPRAVKDIARYQRLRNDLDVQISLERNKRTYSGPERHLYW
jgi:hypothetical protein